jgi:hypothetical protein
MSISLWRYRVPEADGPLEALAPSCICSISSFLCGRLLSDVQSLPSSYLSACPCSAQFQHSPYRIIFPISTTEHSTTVLAAMQLSTPTARRHLLLEDPECSQIKPLLKQASLTLRSGTLGRGDSFHPVHFDHISKFSFSSYHAWERVLAVLIDCPRNVDGGDNP